MRVKISVMVLLAVVFAGCATEHFNSHPDLMNFLSDGKTTREEVMLKLGQPSGTFEREKILTYRLGFDPKNRGYFVVGRAPGYGVYPAYTTWENTKFSLVLVFNEDNMLREHSLVEVLR